MSGFLIFPTPFRHLADISLTFRYERRLGGRRDYLTVARLERDIADKLAAVTWPLWHDHPGCAYCARIMRRLALWGYLVRRGTRCWKVRWHAAIFSRRPRG